MRGFGPFASVDNLDADELRLRLRALVTIFAKAPVPIAVAHDPACRFISANAALAALLGLPEDANISLTPQDGTEPPYRIQQHGVDVPTAELPMQYAIAHHTTVRSDIEIVRRDGTVVYVQNDVEPLFDSHGGIYGCVSVCVDHSDRRRAEIALREADRRKDEFLATLSHELRNPLAPIRTALEVMRLAGDDLRLVERARATMERQVLHMVRITDDLLDLARITQNKVELRRERLDLRTVVQGAVDAVAPFIDAQGHTMTVAVPREPIWLDADPTRISQVLANLLNNAAKYTDPGGQIRIEAETEDGAAAITISDSGIGIPHDMLPRVFDMFTQLPTATERAHGGLGIGLTLARRLIEMHGGTVDAASEGLGRGSRFTVRLPLATAPVAGLSATNVAAPRSRCRILLADDNRDAGEMLKVMLEMQGHEVVVAGDGLQALSMATAFRPQLALLDIGMPRLDGYETARRFRDLFGDRVMLVALTGWGQDEDKRRSYEAGFDLHLTKPVEPDVLERLIAERTQRVP